MAQVIEAQQIRVKLFEKQFMLLSCSCLFVTGVQIILVPLGDRKIRMKVLQASREENI